MRVLMTADTVGGVWSYATTLADGLRERDHRVGLLTVGRPPRPEHGEWLEVRPDVWHEHVDAPLEWEPDTTGLEASFRDVARSAERFRPDVIHLNQLAYGAVELGAPSIVTAHSDVTTWWRATKGEAPPEDPWFDRYRRRVGEGLRGARARVAPTGWIAGAIGKAYGTSVTAIHNGVPAPELRGGNGCEASARRARGGDPIVLSAGRLWDEGKGAADLAGAAAALDARVVMAGPFRHPAGGSDFDPGDSPVEMTGPLPHDALLEQMGRAAVYVATSRYEPFGLAPVEAALSGCALVLSDIPTFRELWDGDGVFYAPGDAAELARAVRRLLDEGGERDALAERARGRAERCYSPARMTSDYERLYGEVVAG